jgi:hypothetical protein
MREALQKLVDEMEVLLGEGRRVLRIELIRNVLRNILASTPGNKAELDTLYYQLTQEGKMAQWKEERESFRLLLNSVMVFAGGALKVITWMNGGAAVACLAYCGNVKDSRLLDAMLWFAGGLLVGGIAHGGAYLAQYKYAYGKERGGNVFRYVTMVLVIVAYVAFLIGVLSGYFALGKVNTFLGR